MKKLIKAIGVLLTAFCLFGCDNPANDEENKKETQKEIILKYNDWGTVPYSLLQSDSFKISEIFTVEDSEDSDKVNLSWKGKSNRNMKKLHILIMDDNWKHYKTEEENKSPVANNIEARKEFTFTITIDRALLNKEDINFFFCCGIEDTEGPVHLYSTEAENTEQYDEYMNETGNAILNSPVKVEEKGKITFNNSTKSFKYTKYPKIKLADGKIYDCSKGEEKTALLEKGYFYLTFVSDYTRKNEKGENEVFWRTTSNKETNSCGHASWEPTDDDFKDYDISYLFDEDNKNKSVPLRCDCLYFALADENEEGTTKEELYNKQYDEYGYVQRDEDGNEIKEFIKNIYYYFPVVAFDFVEVEE